MNEQPKRRGGARPGSGPKPKGRVKRDVSLPPEVWALIEDHQRRAGIRTRSEAVESLVRLATTANR
jgi:hypothetical protein